MTKVLRFAAVVALTTGALACGGVPEGHFAHRPPPPLPALVQAPPSPLQIATGALPAPKQIAYLKCQGKQALSGDTVFCFDDQPRSFSEAESHCEEIGGRLATVGDESESRVLRAGFGTPFDLPNSLWIGLVEPFREGEWGWMGGKRATYQNWAGGEPNDAGGGEDCAERYSASGLWNDLDCAASRAFLCEGPGASSSAAPGKIKGRVKSSFSCTGTAIQAGDTPYCLYSNGSLNAAQAEQFCKSTGGHLAELSTEEKDKALFAVLGPRAGNGEQVWIGFTDEGREGEWRKVTGERAGFTAWRAGEPNNVGAGGENCATWGPWDGLWNDAPCGMRAQSICRGLVDPAAPPKDASASAGRGADL